jgi:hypothetical protein
MTRRAFSLASSALLLALATGCASKPPPEYVPPRLDLAQYRALGILEIDARGQAEIGASATQELLAAIHDAQPGTPVLELGPRASALPASAGAKLDPAAIRALAQREQVDAIWVGEIVESESKPRFAIDPMARAGSASQERKAKLSVRLLDGVSGATVWSAWSERTIPVVAVDGAFGALPSVRTTPVDEARAILVRDLVVDVTYDLRPRWVQR